MDSLLFYPILTKELADQCGINTDKYNFSFSYQGNSYDLVQSGTSTVRLSDTMDIWKVETEGLTFKKKVSIAYPELLHGYNGVVCKDAIIAMCILWTNKSLTQTGCILPIYDHNSETGRICLFQHTFAPGEITGDLELKVVLYIQKSADKIYHGEESFINEDGVIIGEIERTVLDFNSIYMDFPIEELFSPDEPLWWLYMSWEDPKVDLFNKDSICLYLNPFYQACPMVGEKIKNLDLLIDILATTYLMVFNKISENDADLTATIHDVGLENGSICSIMFHFIDSCPQALQFGSQEGLLKSLQINLRQILKEGDE